MKIYTEEEAKQLIKDSIQATMRGMMNWYESDNTWIEDKDTKQRIENCELQANRDVSPFNEYISPLLKEKGITYIID